MPVTLFVGVFMFVGVFVPVRMAVSVRMPVRMTAVRVIRVVVAVRESVVM